MTDESLPVVTIVATTYFDVEREKRMEAFRTALASWAVHLQYDGRLAIHIADDGAADDPWPRIVAAPFVQSCMTVFGRDRDGIVVSTSWQQRRGVGASLNAGFEVAHDGGGIALYLVDDWELLAPLDLTPWVRVMLDDPSVGMVRLGPPHPWLTGTIQTFPSGWGMRLDRHHYAFGHRPALYHPRMREAYGPFAEMVNAYDCERLYAEHWARTAGPDIVLALPDLWRHIDGVELADIEPTG